MLRWIVEHLMYVNLAWYAVLALGFATIREWPMFLYFGGAATLTVGVIWQYSK